MSPTRDPKMEPRWAQPVEEVMTSPRRRVQRLARIHMTSRDDGTGAVAVRSGSGRGAGVGNGNSGSVVVAAVVLGEIESGV